MTEARRQHWATAGPVLIEGATGSKSAIVNGGFEVAERPDNEPPIYRRADGSDGWLYVSNAGKWTVGDEEDKDTRETSLGWAHSVEAAEGRLPHEVGAAWKVHHNDSMKVSGNPTEQQLRVLHGEEAEVAIAEVCVYAHAPAGTHTNTSWHLLVEVVLDLWL